MRQVRRPRQERWRKRRKRSAGASFRYILSRFIVPVVIISVLALAQFLPKEETVISDEVAAVPQRERAAEPKKDETRRNAITCNDPYIIDGDTFSCGKHRIRLSGIDAPEMPDHCRAGRRCTPGDPFASRDYLQSLSRGLVKCYPIERDSYGRIIARCEAKGRDLSCAMVDAGHAIKRYRPLSCP